MALIPLDDPLNLVSNIACAAGEAIMPYFRRNKEVQQKADGSPVTLADQTAEKLIIEKLKEIWPDIPSVGEESVSAGVSPSYYDKYWLIDPLDGTREFVNDRDEFTVNIALIEKGLPTLGVIYAPAKNLLYAGSEKLGSYKAGINGQWEKLPAINGRDMVTVAVSRSHPTAGAEESFLNLLKRGQDVDIIKTGSSLKFCLVAEGSADIYFRAGRTMFWDSGAGHAIAKFAGAEILEWGSEKEIMYVDNSFENPSFIVVSPRCRRLAVSIGELVKMGVV